MISRYTLPRMGKIWDEEGKFGLWLKIEILVCQAWAKLGKIPPEVVKKIEKDAGFDINRIRKIEEKVKHDLISFLTSVTEHLGPEARYIHFGLTSSDVVDTALALQMKLAGETIIQDLEKLIQVLEKKAREYKGTLMMGRTHGVHAEPISLGLKFALWYEETKRNLELMRRAKEIISCGKISGAVGTYAHLDPRVEEYVCRRLDLTPCSISSQIIQRDRHAQYLSALAIIASSLGKFALEIRGLHRTEIREAEEGFGKEQKGSSAMPHKRNPIVCERICGLARLVRSNLQTALENISLWGERDISHSSSERVVIPDSTILVDYMLEKLIQVLNNLFVYPEHMRKNMAQSKGLFYSQRIMLELVEKGLSREEAYELVQRISLKVWREDKDFQQLIEQDKKISRYFKKKELESFFDPDYYLRWVDHIFQKVGISTTPGKY
ncbi:MAG: adenylosuccinate lyase [bacterium]